MVNSQSEAVFVNVVEVEPSRYQELLAIVKEGNDTVIRRRDGFISAFIAATPDKSRVVTVARWRSADAIKALQSDPIVTEFGRRTAAVAKSNPMVFTIVEEYRP
jgi:heme-degrading monooxygenase HmoA